MRQNKNNYASGTQTQKKRPVKWVCSVCGYVYEGPDIPNDFICPVCGKDITVFLKKYE